MAMGRMHLLAQAGVPILQGAKSSEPFTHSEMQPGSTLQSQANAANVISFVWVPQIKPGHCTWQVFPVNR